MEYPRAPTYIINTGCIMKKIAFTGGGSAGHVVPNLALIESLDLGKTDVCYIGTDGIEKGLVTAQKISYFEISCPKLIRGGGLKGLWKNLRIPFAFLRAVKQAEKGLRAFQPDLLFSKGGYVSLPVIFAARKLKIPCFTHESDYSVGLANKLAARKCEYVFTYFPETAAALPNGTYAGALLRKSTLYADRAEARKKRNIPHSATVLLIFGGGSGSEAINAAVRKHIKTLTEKYVVLHVCGKGKTVESNLKNYFQYEFIADMGGAYACADLVVSRAGAGAVFECLAHKKRAIFIPLENASRGDQKQNAEYFSKKGLCRILPQSRLDELPTEIEKTLFDERLTENLQAYALVDGNENILRALKPYLS